MMKICFLNAGLYSQMAAQHLKEKFNFKICSISSIVTDIIDTYFNEYKDQVFYQKFKNALDSIDKNILINKLINNLPEGDIVVPDICTLKEYYILASEDFIPIRLQCSMSNHDSALDLMPIINLEVKEDIKLFNDNIDYLIANYATLEVNKFKGGIIKYVEE